MTQENDKKDLIIASLRERIGNLVSNYEMEIAHLRTEFTELKINFDKVVGSLEEMKKVNDPKKIYREADNV